MTLQTETIPAPETPPGDPFNLSRLRLGQNFAETIGVEKSILTIPVRKPSRQDFFRVHPDPAWHLETVVLELREERETYLVDPEIWSVLPNEVVPKVLFTTLNRQGVLSLWPVRLPGEDGRHDEWSRSALEAALMAQTTWVRMAANLSLGAYELYQAVGALSAPVWPEVSFQEILKIAFKERFIRDLAHPVVRRLRGES